jgi:hypothetical protein
MLTIPCSADIYFFVSHSSSKQGKNAFLKAFYECDDALVCQLFHHHSVLYEEYIQPGYESQVTF